MAMWKDYIPGYQWYWQRKYKKAMWRMLGDADALMLVPYGDGVVTWKRGYFDKQLVGHYSGYETPDGDRFIIDGIGGDAARLDGIPVVVCLDPSQHASVLEPVKSVIAAKNDLGEWIRVDARGDVVEPGPAVEADSAETGTATADGGVEMGAPGVQSQQSTADVPLGDGTADPRVDDKLFDVRPPEGADGWVVSLEKAADLVPRKITTDDIQREVDKARIAEHDQDKWQAVAMKWFFIGVGTTAGIVGLLWFLGQIGSAGGGAGFNVPFYIVAAFAGVGV